MSAVLENPIVNPYLDPTAGLEIQVVRDPNLETTRWVFGAGQLLDPDRLRTMEHIRAFGGGEEIETNCFRRTPAKLLPRAYLTPLEIWTSSIPIELVGEGAEHDIVRVVQKNKAISADDVKGMRQRPGFLMGQSNVHIKHYPGDELKNILRIYEHKGIVEIKSLFDREWNEGVGQQLNADFFGIGAKPATLRGIRELIYKSSSLSALHSQVAGEMNPACDIFERFATAQLAIAHGLLRERKSHNYVHSYTPCERSYLAQLEMSPQDVEYHDTTRSLVERITEMQAGQQVTPEMIGEIVKQVVMAQVPQPEKRGPGRPPKDKTEE